MESLSSSLRTPLPVSDDRRTRAAFVNFSCAAISAPIICYEALFGGHEAYLAKCEHAMASPRAGTCEHEDRLWLHPQLPRDGVSLGAEVPDPRADAY